MRGLSLEAVQAAARARLPGTAWPVWLAHAARADERGVSRARVGELAAVLTLDRRQVYAAERALEAAGLLELERNARGHRTAAVLVAEASLVVEVLRQRDRFVPFCPAPSAEIVRLDEVRRPTDQTEVRREPPRTRAECIDGPRPCPWTQCRYHLHSAQQRVSGDWGSKPGSRARELDEMPETCALDVADRGEHTLEQIGEVLGLSVQRVSQIIGETLQKLRRTEAGALLAEYLDGDDERPVARAADHGVLPTMTRRTTVHELRAPAVSDQHHADAERCRLEFVIPGDPIGKGRPRFTAGGAYTPAKTRAWERDAATLASVAARRVGWSVERNEPLVVVVRAVKSRPQRLSRRTDPDGRLVRTSKPDCDNVVKAVLDALQLAGVLADDAQVHRLEAESWYAARGEEACVEVEVRHLPGAAAPTAVGCAR